MRSQILKDILEEGQMPILNCRIGAIHDRSPQVTYYSKQDWDRNHKRALKFLEQITRTNESST